MESVLERLKLVSAQRNKLTTPTRVTRRAPTRMKAPTRETASPATTAETPASSEPKVETAKAETAGSRTRKAPAGRKRQKAPSKPSKDDTPIETEDTVVAKADTPATKKSSAKKKGKKEAPLPTFSELGLNPKILRALDDLGYKTPTPIQAQSIPHAIQNKDVLGIAQTGTGKTGAFVLPVMHRMASGRARARMPRCLIICPTRELAAQVAENVELYSKYLKMEMALLIGGVSFKEQDAKLNKGVDILIATPGRLLDQFERGKILLNGVQTLVVDEADRMLDMGFIPDIERIFEITPFTRQVLFFSATMAPEITRIVDTFLHQPVRVEVARESRTADTVTQTIITMPSNDTRAKRNALRGAIEQSEVKNGIVFCNRKRDVDIVAKSLSKYGHQALPIHGDLPQSERMKTLQSFRDGNLKLLVASDVAARGLDVPDVSHVFNFDVPSHSEDYVHRIGRTGRAGRKGDTIMLVTPGDSKNFDAVKRLIKIEKFNEFKLEGVSLEADVRESDKRYKNKDRNSGGRGGRNSGGRSNNRNDRRPRPVADHGQRADMTPAFKGDSEDAPRPSKSNNRNRSKTSRKSHENKAAHSETKPSTPKTNAPRADNTKPATKKQPNASQNQTAQSSKQKEPRRSAYGNPAPEKRKRHKSDLPASKEAGFGNEMPAFFGNKLK